MRLPKLLCAWVTLPLLLIHQHPGGEYPPPLSLSSCIYIGTHLLFPTRVLAQRSRLYIFRSAEGTRWSYHGGRSDRIDDRLGWHSGVSCKNREETGKKRVRRTDAVCVIRVPDGQFDFKMMIVCRCPSCCCDVPHVLLPRKPRKESTP